MNRLKTLLIADLRRFARRSKTLLAFLTPVEGERGVAAVEFAFILPTMLILFTGVWIYGTVVEINRKVTITAYSLADLVSQYETLTTADMTTLMNSAAQVMAPFGLSNAVVFVALVTVNSSGQASIVWSESLTNGTIKDPAASYSPGTTVAIPNNMALSAASGQCPATYLQSSPGAGSCLIWANVTYTYTPTIGYQVTGPITLTDNIYMNPRLSTAVFIDQTSTTP
jgi:Flp pilus assembly protein TadG